MSGSGKTILLLKLIFLLSMPVSAEIIGGYDRQRLMLHFQTTLTQYFEAHPVVVNLTGLPVELSDNSETNARYLYDVLVEEGFLQRETRVRQLGNDESLATRVFRYRLRENRETESIAIGVVNITGLSQWDARLEPEGDETWYDVTFYWQLEDPAPWLWAPTLQSNESLRSFINAINEPATGSAAFQWLDGRWQLRSTNL